MTTKDQKPTDKRLREARRKGEVVFSTDIASTAVFVFVVIGLWLLGATVVSLLRELWLHATSATVLSQPGERMGELWLHTVRVLLWALLPLMGLAALGGIAGSFFQVGGLLAWERLQPDMNRMNPAEGLKRLFSSRNLINLLKMSLKTALLALLMYGVIRSFIPPLLKVGHLAPAGIMDVGARSLLILFAWAAVIYVLMAGLDYAHEHHEFIKKQRMSIDEVRRDHKESEGDPTTRGRRRSAHYESVYAGMADRVAIASAVIHSARVAVALQYLGEKDLPRVIARGENEIAAQIRRFAGESLVPMEFDAALAERLYDEVPLDQPIPRALYAPVATLLRWATGQS